MFGHKGRLTKELQENGGAVAWATVLESRRRWSSSSGSPNHPGRVTDHMRVKLQVLPDSDVPFEAELSQAFPGATPMQGGQCKVIYDPADHSRIVVLEDSVTPPGLTREQAERAAVHRAEVRNAVETGTIAEYVAERKAQALQQAAPQPNVVDQLTKLADLRDRGVLTEAEFAAQKAKLLAQG